MTDIEKFNLDWLSHAMTMPACCEESYYYDGRLGKLFYTKSSRFHQEELALFDSINLPVPSNERAGLLARLNAITEHGSELFEIPRLDLQGKLSIQKLFVSIYENTPFWDMLTSYIGVQPNDQGFALDAILKENTLLRHIAPYWEEFKLQAIQSTIFKYARAIGVKLEISA